MIYTEGFVVLDKIILLSHSLGSQSQTDGDGGEEIFWDIGDNNTDEEDNSFEPMITMEKDCRKSKD